MDGHAAAWKILQEDLRGALKDHEKGCHHCSPKHVCGFALGLNKAYGIVEGRLSPIREPLL